MTALRKIFTRQEKSATTDDVHAIAGPLDDTIATAILRTGATADEVLQAFEKLEENYYTRSVFIRPMDERGRCVYDILDYGRSGLDWGKHKH